LDNAGIWQGRRLLTRVIGGASLAVDARRVPRARGTWALLALSPWFLLLALLVYLRARQPAIAHATFILFSVAGVALALAPAADADLPPAVLAEFAVVALFAGSFAHFFLHFPRPSPAPLLRRLAWALPAGTIALYALSVTLRPDLNDSAYLLRLACLLAALVLGLVLLVRSFFGDPENISRRGLAVIAVGTAAAIGPFIAFYLAPSLIGRGPLLSPEQAILPIALLPASFAYAILRHDVLHIQLLQRWLVVGLLWIGLIVLYAALGAAILVACPKFLPHQAAILASSGALVVLVAVSFPLLMRGARDQIDHRFFKDIYNYRGALHQLSQNLSLSRDLEALKDTVLESLCRLLNLDFAALLVSPEGNAQIMGAVGVLPPDLLPLLTSATRPVRIDSKLVIISLFSYVPVLLVPLRTHDVLAGHLCLGPKTTGEPFRPQDHDLLATISGHLAAIVRNVALVNDLREKVRVLALQSTALEALYDRVQRAQEEERLRLATDIHDEPLQTAITLQRALASHEDGGERARQAQLGLSEHLITQLRAACTAMRPPALDDLGLGPALDLLAKDVSSRSGIPVRVDADPGLAGSALLPEVRLLFYRTAQEAVRNSLRHADPRAIAIILRCVNGLPQLVITDDGKGFTVLEHLIDLVAQGHLGLVGLRERVRHAGGTLTVDSGPGHGTAVQVDFPLGSGAAATGDAP